MVTEGKLEKGKLSKSGCYPTRHFFPLSSHHCNWHHGSQVGRIFGFQLWLGTFSLIRRENEIRLANMRSAHQQPILKYTKLSRIKGPARVSTHHNKRKGTVGKKRKEKPSTAHCAKRGQEETWSKLWVIRKQRVMVSKLRGKNWGLLLFSFFPPKNQLTASVSAGWTFKYRFELKQGGSSLAFHRKPDSSEISFHSSVFQSIIVTSLPITTTIQKKLKRLRKEKK